MSEKIEMRDDKRINVNGLMVSEDFLFRYIGALHNEKTKLKKKVEELEKENEQLKQKLTNLDLNEKNDAVKMVDGKFFIRV